MKPNVVRARPLLRATGVRVALPADFDFAAATSFLATREVPSLERITPEGIRRCLRVAGRVVTLEIRHELPNGKHGALLASSTPALPARTVRGFVERMFDLGAELEAFHAMAAKDAVLRRIVTGAPRLRLPQLLDPFEGIVRAVLGQQVSVAAARTMTDRLVRLLGTSPANGS